MGLSILTLEGATCSMCANPVSIALHSIEGVKNLDIDLADAVATITYDDDTVTENAILETVDDTNCSSHDMIH